MPRRLIKPDTLDALLDAYFKTEKNLGGYLVLVRQEFPNADSTVLEAVWYGFNGMERYHATQKTP